MTKGSPHPFLDNAFGSRPSMPPLRLTRACRSGRTACRRAELPSRGAPPGLGAGRGPGLEVGPERPARLGGPEMIGRRGPTTRPAAPAPHPPTVVASVLRPAEDPRDKVPRSGGAPDD